MHIVGNLNDDGCLRVNMGCLHTIMVSSMFIFMTILNIFIGDEQEDDDDSSSDEEFRYPSSSPRETIRPASRASRASSSADYFSRQSISRIPSDLTPQLSQAPDFRVPTHEAPQKVLTPRWTSPTPHQLNAQWERDEVVHQCHDCQRRFNFITRRVSSPTIWDI